MIEEWNKRNIWRRRGERGSGKAKSERENEGKKMKLLWNERKVKRIIQTKCY